MTSLKDEIDSLLNKTTQLVNPIIKKLLGLYVDKKNQKAVEYHISTGGKRLRPALAIISSKLLGGKTREVLYPAAGLEILHNYTLIIDDIIDHSNLRRGKPTVWFKFGRSIAQCIGADYSAAIFQSAQYSKNALKISDIFSKTIKAVVDGEILDILFEQSGRDDENYVVENRYQKIEKSDYLKMVKKKTAVLLQSSCEVGAVCALAKNPEIEALKKYGLNLGIVFQIKDDILDIFGDEKKFGKKIGKDIEERKLGNIVIFYALKELPLFKKKKLLAVLKRKKIRKRDIKEAISLIKETQAKEKSFALAEKYIRLAKESLKKLPQNKWNKILSDIAEFVIQRNK